MTSEQIDDLFAEWDLYDENAKREMLKEFIEIGRGDYSMEKFFEFLRDKLEISCHWPKAGSA